MTEARVVVGVDGSPPSEHAARWAAALCAHTGRQLVAVYAWEYPIRASFPTTGDGPGPTSREMEQSAAAQLAALMTVVRADYDIAIDEVVGEGYPSLVVMNQALPGDIVVVGTRGRGAIRQLLLGSTSRQIATHAPVPVVVVPKGAPIELGSVVVGVDGSDSSVEALRWALELGFDQVVAMHAWTMPTLFPVDAEAVAFQELEQQARERIAKTIAGATRAGADASTVRSILRYGDARTQLAEPLDERSPDLVVVGPRGHGPLASALLGSVATYLISHADCAVAVVH